MAIANLINEDVLLKMLKDQINESMMAACEPLIKEAISGAEKVMREQLALQLIALMQNEFSIERMGNDMRIIVRGALNK